MTIDPLTIPCAYCGGFPDRYDNSQVYCQYCLSLEDEDAVLQTDDDWITGGINALVGELTKRHIHFSFTKTPNRNYWSCWQEDSSVVNGGWLSFGGRFDTFEEAVLDAWEALKKEGK